MKIKEVITKTDLTDRAIRLYIENGLVSPSISENYSGRKNIEFSDDDLITLQNIATLRKAEFSIAEIKSIIESPSECKRVLESFLTNKHERIEADTKIVEALSPLLNSEEPDINSICENLNAVTADKPVPEADTKTPLWEKIERIFFLIITGISLTYAVFYMINTVYTYTFTYDFKYPYGLGLVFLIVSFVILTGIPIYYLFQYGKCKRVKHGILRPILSFCLIAPIVFIMFYSFIFSFVFNDEPFFRSQTDKVSNYLVVDEGCSIPEDFFPEKIPEYVKTHKYISFLPFEKTVFAEYFYRYTIGFGLTTDIVFELNVNHLHEEDDFFGEIDRMKARKTWDGNPPTVKKKGDWTLYYYADSSETDLGAGYTYVIFAYDNMRRVLRYIYSYNNVQRIANSTIPYYLTLDWYS